MVGRTLPFRDKLHCTQHLRSHLCDYHCNTHRHVGHEEAQKADSQKKHFSYVSRRVSTQATEPNKANHDCEQQNDECQILTSSDLDNLIQRFAQNSFRFLASSAAPLYLILTPLR